MSLSSHQLDAFQMVARTLNFSEAAKRLHVTQSALSQRIQKLESELETALFVRTRGGIQLTEVGERLLRYCQAKEVLEGEFLTDLVGTKDELLGVLRIASYSSVLRSVLLPVLAPILRENPKLRCEWFSREMSELPGMLRQGEADFIVTDSPLVQEGIESHVLGTEEYVVIEPKNVQAPADLFLDHDVSDTATSEFFRKQKAKPPKYRRSYLDDVYGILDGVQLGIGRAVMSRHLLTKEMLIKIVKDFQPRRVEIVLQYYRQPFYSRLQKRVIKELVANCKRYLPSV